MAAKLTIGFLGAGRMATALAQGFVKTGIAKPAQISACDVVPAASKAFAAATGGTPERRRLGASGVGTVVAIGADVAAAIAHHVAGAQWVWCGDYSLDRGAGSVPAFVAAHLDAEQALGVINVELERDHVVATRRLDGGRREVLEVRAPAVVSVEGATARLRRAALPALRAARDAAIDVTPPATPMHRSEWPVRPYRPRARALAAPAGASPLDRLRVLTDAAAASAARGETVALSPADAAARIVRALRDWGYLEASL